MTRRRGARPAAAAMLVLILMSTSVPGPAGAQERRRNRLASESSPYLLQHQLNPVDWYPWGEEAFAAARKADRPIFLSIGYSTCHWCHVMECESFENKEIAALMNRDFVAIKVDREERPDLDGVYMTACQLMTHSGGWPLTVFLTPDGRPFFAGTYYPPDDRYGRTGMRTLLPRVAEAWRTQRAAIEEQATSLAEAVRQALASPPGRGDAPALDRAFGDGLLGELGARFDPVHAGFGGEPKFPPHSALRYLLFRARQERNPDVDRMLRGTLDAMQDGGIFDQVGGGFHRYSVDAEWFLPHFEKMLYDNAQLLEIYAGAARIYGDGRYRETADRIADWLEREMRTPEGAFASALDADSEGEEGRYYLWTSEELERVLGKEAFELYGPAFGIRERGNLPPSFEEGRGRNLPRSAAPREQLARQHRLTAAELAAALLRDQEKLESVRRRRVPPARDDKVLTAWNALAVSALARASRDLEEPRLLAISRRVADFLLKTHVRGDEVFHVSRGGTPKIGGFLEDYALLARALLDLAEATGDGSCEARARALARGFLARFGDGRNGGFYETASAAPRGLLDSSKEFLDQVLPSPNAVAAEVLRRLDERQPDAAFARAASETIRAAAPYARAYPTAAAGFAILSSGVAAAPRPLPSSLREGPVAISADLADSVLAPGGSSTLTVRIAVDAGWHIPDHRPSGADQRPTEVALHPSPGLSAGPPAYPAGVLTRAGGEELSVYSGSLEIPARIHAAPGADEGEASVRVRVSFQPCDDARCLAPRTVELSVPARIGRPSADRGAAPDRP